MQAINNKVIVKEDKPLEKIGSIYVPYQLKPQIDSLPMTGIIISAGPKADPALKPGMRIVFSRMAPMSTYKDLLIMTDKDVQGIVEE